MASYYSRHRTSRVISLFSESHPLPKSTFCGIVFLKESYLSLSRSPRGIVLYATSFPLPYGVPRRIALVASLYSCCIVLIAVLYRHSTSCCIVLPRKHRHCCLVQFIALWLTWGIFSIAYRLLLARSCLLTRHCHLLVRHNLLVYSYYPPLVSSHLHHHA